MLVRAAHSANIKERRDASTALFDARRRDGHAGRAHPGPSRRDARCGRGRDRGRAATAGDAWILNDPYRGGTHLPDITLVSPLFVGGRAASPSPPAARTTPTSAASLPGSMPAARRTLDEEGVVIPPTRLAAAASSTRRCSRPDRADARPAPAGGRPARPAGRQPARRQPAGASSRAPRARRCCERAWQECSTTPSGARGPRIERDPRRAVRGARRARGRRRSARARSRSRSRVRGDGARGRLRRHRTRRAPAT